MNAPSLRLAGSSEKPLPRRARFTASALAAILPPAGKSRTWVRDEKVPGLAFVVTNTGKRSFYFTCKFNGEHGKKRYGAFPAITVEQARKMALKDNHDRANGIDPFAERKTIRASITLEELYKKYDEDHAKLRSTDRTRVTDKSRFETCFGDWKSRKIATIKPADVSAKHVTLGKTLGQITANRAVQLLRRLFGFAKIEPNPAAKGAVDFFPERSRERFLQPEEVERFFAALDAAENGTIRDLILMSLWTGARRSNVQAMKWADLSYDRAVWYIPGDESKSREPMTVHLPPQALEILKRRAGNNSPFVFPGSGKTGHIVETKATWGKILTAAKIEDFHMHDLRRTLGSWMAAAGASLPLIGKQLGHHDVATTAIYSRLNIDPARTFVDAAAKAIEKARGKIAKPTAKKTAPGGRRAEQRLPHGRSPSRTLKAKS